MSVTLILGGARSGKSDRACRLAGAQGLPVTYVATAPAIEGDVEWRNRIAQHRRDRPADWRTIEEPLALCAVLSRESNEDRVVLVDCLSLWVSNLLLDQRDMEREFAAMVECLRACSGSVILVSNEVGMGLVPESALGRSFRDAQGRLNQAVAAVADRVEFVAAGIPLLIKGGSE